MIAVDTLERSTLETPGLEGVVLRYGMFYGPGTWYAKDGDVGRQVRKRRYPVIGHGEGTYSFIHIDDAASATVAALERARPGFYNVVDDEPATAAEWMPVYAEAVGAKRPLRVPAFVARLIAGRALVEWSLSLRGASNEKIKEELAKLTGAREAKAPRARLGEPDSDRALPNELLNRIIEGIGARAREGSDPASVVFDAIQSGRARGRDPHRLGGGRAP